MLCRLFTAQRQDVKLSVSGESKTFCVPCDESYAYETTRGDIFISICITVLYGQPQAELCLSKSVVNLLS